MFVKRQNKNTLKIIDLVKIVREAHLSNASINVIHEDEESKSFEIVFEKFNIIDSVKNNGSSSTEIHNIEIKLRDGTKEMSVYKSPKLFFEIDSLGKPQVEVNDWLISISKKQMKNKKIDWIHEGEWCTYIIDEINALGLKIESAKLKLKVEKRKNQQIKIPF